MRKKVAVLLALVMAFGLLTPGFKAGAAPVGAAHGFVLAETGSIDIVGAETFLYVHEATGARVFHMANDDTNRSIIVSFETPTHDNRGIPHILEHMVLAGSRNFPALNLFFSLLYQTYSTAINAFVMNAATGYLYATMSEEQLLLITEYFMDSVFFPLIYDYELIFGQEAWRLEMADADAPLNVTGIVYNEMRGLMDIHFTANQNWLNALLPGTVAANNAGGNPEDILTLTLDDLLEYHKTYYHPSNMIVFLYGNLDIDPFLEVIARYSDMFDRQDIYVEKGHIEPFAAPVRKVLPFPAAMGTPTENSSVLNYAVHIGHAGIDTIISMDVLAMLLGVEPSPVMQHLRAAFPGGTFGVSQVDTTLGANLVVTGIGLNEDDMDAFQTAIHAAIDEIATVGFDPDLVEAIVATYEFSMLSLTELPALGVTLSQILILCHSVGLGLDYFNDIVTTLDRIRAGSEGGYFENLIRAHVVDNPHRALVATVPVPGLREELDAELRAELDAIRAGMTDAEVDALIAQNAVFAEMAAATPDEAIIESLNAVTVDTLPMEVRTFNVREWDHGGARILTSEAAVGGVYSVALNLNAAAVPLEELHFLNLYAAMLGQTPTLNYDLPTLQTLIFRYLNGFSTAAGARPHYDFVLRPVFMMEWMGLNHDFPAAADLAMEILLNTDVTDLETISGLIRRSETVMRANLNSNPLAILNARALSGSSDRHAFIDYMRGLAYFEFLSNANQMIEDDPEGFIANLESARNRLIHLEGSAAKFAGNADGIATFEDNLSKLLGHLQEGAVPAADLSALPAHASREAIILESAVQFNVLFIPFAEIEEQTGLAHSAALAPLMEMINDGHLTPEVRFNIGAYGVFGIVDRYGVAMISFWDPAVAETIAAYAATADFVRESGISQSDLDRFIISVFANESAPVGELTGALRAALFQYMGYPEGHAATQLADITTASVADLAAFADALDLAVDSGIWITAGSAGAINANLELFDDVSSAFGDAGDEPRGISRIEFLQTIIGDIDDLYEIAVGAGIILDIADPFDPLTREEFAFVLIMASGGDEIMIDADIPITDADQISDWALAAVITALAFEVLSLDEEGRFNPQGTVTLEDLWAALS